MLKTTTALTAAMLLLLTMSAQAGSQKSSSMQSAGTAQASAEVKAVKPAQAARVPEYLNVAGFKASVRDPRYAYAAVPAPQRPASAPRATVSQFPMPFTAWW